MWHGVVVEGKADLGEVVVLMDGDAKPRLFPFENLSPTVSDTTKEGQRCWDVSGVDGWTSNSDDESNSDEGKQDTPVFSKRKKATGNSNSNSNSNSNNSSGKTTKGASLRASEGLVDQEIWSAQKHRLSKRHSPSSHKDAGATRDGGGIAGGTVVKGATGKSAAGNSAGAAGAADAFSPTGATGPAVGKSAAGNVKSKGKGKGKVGAGKSGGPHAGASKASAAATAATGVAGRMAVLQIDWTVTPKWNMYVTPPLDVH
jgi:hypothetical protein